jgi:LysM repeat protein
VSKGEPVFSVGDGVVLASFYHPETFGEYIRIQHRDGYSSVYAHLDKGSRFVSKGDKVSEGQIIGQAGQTGNASYPQLRFEVAVGEVIINPARFFEIVARYSMPEHTEESEPGTHIVQPGENLTATAKHHKTTVQALQKINNIARAADIAPGQKIKTQPDNL